MFYLTTHSTHFIYGYMASDIWLRTILILRKEIRCRHIGYSYRLTARVLLYAPSHRQDSTYCGLCYTSCGALAGTRNSSMGPLLLQCRYTLSKYQMCRLLSWFVCLFVLWVLCVFFCVFFFFFLFFLFFTLGISLTFFTAEQQIRLVCACPLSQMNWLPDLFVLSVQQKWYILSHITSDMMSCL